MPPIIRFLGAILVAILPWRLKRLVYVHLFKWDISSDAWVGFSVLQCPNVILRSGARIGHLNLIRNCQVVELDEHASVGYLNWITGHPLSRTDLYRLETDRRPELRMGRHASVTMLHIIDCTDLITIGSYAIIGGSQTTIYTHTADLRRSRIACAPIAIGDYTFIGTNCSILPGAAMADYSVLGAKSLLRSNLAKSYALYGGVPAQWVKDLPQDLAYFHRKDGNLRDG